jgi:hypothetical protein
MEMEYDSPPGQPNPPLTEQPSTPFGWIIGLMLLARHCGLCRALPRMAAVGSKSSLVFPLGRRNRRDNDHNCDSRAADTEQSKY